MSDTITADTIDLSFLVGDRTGFEELDSSVMSLPFINILQDLSPQVKRKSETYVDGAEPGMFFNTGTSTAHEVLNVTVIKFEHVYLRWRPNRGGFFGQFNVEDVMRMRTSGEIFEESDGKLVDGDGNSYDEAYTYYLVLWDENDQPSIAVFSCTGSKLKEARRWNRELATRRLPNGQIALPYFSVYRMTVKVQSNEKGSWYGFTFEWQRFVSPNMFSDVTAERKELPQRTISYTALETTAVPAIETTGFEAPSGY